jgi:hypothetical protein
MDEIERLRERTRILAAGLGVDESFEVPDEVRRLVREGETVKAVRDLRRAAKGLGLVAAKRMVDALGR